MNRSVAQIGTPLHRWTASRLVLTCAGALAIWALIAVGCMCVGSHADIGWPPAGFTRKFRLETVLISSLVGASLAAAGVVYQAILRNPLADPYLLGVSGGASLCAYIWRLPLAAGLLGGSIFGAISQQAFAFAGSIVVVAIVLSLATRRGRLEPVTLLLVGVIMNAINGALFLTLYELFPEISAGSGSDIGFFVGGIQTNLTHGQEKTAAAIVGVGWVAMLYLAGQFNIAATPESQAEALGIRIQRLRWVGLLVASIMTAAAVSISGPIGFVGLICPHIARRVVGVDHRSLLPWSTALGAALLCAADAASRLLARHDIAGTQLLGTHLPVGVLTALLGGPFFLLLLWEHRQAE